MRVLIAGKSTDLSLMLRLVPAPEPEIVVVGQVSNEGALFNAARLLHPDLIVLDWMLHPRDNEEWIRYLQTLSGGAQIIVFGNEKSSEHTSEKPSYRSSDSRSRYKQ